VVKPISRQNDVALNAILSIALALSSSLVCPQTTFARDDKASSTPSAASAPSAVVHKTTIAPTSTKQYPVGYAVTSTEYDFKEQKIHYKIAIWYPTSRKDGTHDYILGPSHISANLAVDSPVAQGRFPIIFYSHGATGSGTSSFFTCELLARNGYIVVAPDYLDEVNAARIDETVPFDGFMRMKTTRYIYWLREYGLNKAAREGRTVFAYRPEQLKQTMDTVLAWDKDQENKFHNRIDEEKVGLFGHSFGAWTSLLAAGASPDFHDKRVKAVVALSGPVNEFVFKIATDNDLKDVKVPVLFEYGERETALGRRDDKTLLYDFAAAPKMLISIKDADHLSFSGGIKGEHKLSSEYLDADPIRKTISETTLDFFDGFLKNERERLDALKTRKEGVASSFADF